LLRSGRMQMLMDRTAIALSTACAIHCLFLPVVVVMFPALTTTFFGNENFHHLLLWFVFPTSTIAVMQGCRRHKDKIVLTFVLMGLAFLIATATIGHDFLGEEGERAATVLGAIILVFGHLRNYRLCRKNKCRL
jgi:hypothetical protein